MSESQVTIYKEELKNNGINNEPTSNNNQAAYARNWNTRL